MTVEDKSNKEKSDGQFCVRLQNLPPGACQKQVRDFFLDLTIPAGGVSIHRSCAFVVFASQTDAQLALSMDQRVLGRKVVRVSNADQKVVRRTQLYDVRRQLEVSVPEFIECCTVEKRKKRIRPTTVKECARDGASKKFCPDEIDFPGNVPESCLVDGKVPRRKNASCLLDGKVPGKNESCLLDENVPEKKNESCLLDENVPEKKNESYLLDENVPGTENESCLRGNVFGNDDSCLLYGKVAKKETRLLNGNVLENNKLCLVIGKVPGKVNDSNFHVQKSTKPLKRIPKKKTIKPTPVFNLSQFKLVYEGTVF